MTPRRPRRRLDISPVEAKTQEASIQVNGLSLGGGYPPGVDDGSDAQQLDTFGGVQFADPIPPNDDPGADPFASLGPAAVGLPDDETQTDLTFSGGDVQFVSDGRAQFSQLSAAAAKDAPTTVSEVVVTRTVPTSGGGSTIIFLAPLRIVIPLHYGLFGPAARSGGAPKSGDYVITLNKGDTLSGPGAKEAFDRLVRDKNVRTTTGVLVQP